MRVPMVSSNWDTVIIGFTDIDKISDQTDYYKFE